MSNNVASDVSSTEPMRSPSPEADPKKSEQNSAAAKPNTTADPPSSLFPETNFDKGIVGWDGPHDPKHPMNFSKSRKLLLLGVVSAITLISPLASSMFAPAAGLMGADFGNPQALLLSFSVSVYLIGWAIGPLLLSPLSEIYGRRYILSAGNWLFTVFQIGCALAPNIGSLIVFRLLAGIGGSACLTLGAGVISDMFPVEERGKATAIWSMGPLIGPVIGPICGGFIAQRAGWRWVFWVLLAVGGALSVAIDLLNRETYAPILIRRKTRLLAKEYARPDLRSVYELDTQDHSPGAVLRRGLLRPLFIFVKSPIVFTLSIYMSTVYGLLYLLFTTIPGVFQQQYHFSSETTGLAYIGIGVGFFFGLIAVALTSDRTVVKLKERNGGIYEPEMRFPLLTIFATFVPISYFWYGWTVQYKVHWIVPIIGTMPFSIGMMGIFLPIQNYVLDYSGRYAASGVASLTASRSLVGALLPLAGPDMFEALGYGWGNSLLGFIAFACILIPILFQKYGKTLREKYPLNL